ncbi:MAG: hypothetical protein Q9167_002088 [Letrouitia subvulpina]
MAKKDKKSKNIEKKARVAAKQTKKATQKERKERTRQKDDSDDEDLDLETVLAEYEKSQAQFLKVTETTCPPPSPRASATFIGSPASGKELFLFGGEYYNGAIATFFNDLFVYMIEKDEWRRITSPNSPLPRSGHAWCRSIANEIYLFGGEFSSPKQGTFYHYNDFWKLDPSSREWSKIETKGKGPPARSGHRMTFWKHYILLFGGFQDTSQQTKYLQDLWIYDSHNYTWFSPTLPPASQKPDARSSFSFHPHEDGAVMCGGYARVKTMVAATKNTKGGGGGQSLRSVLKPIIYQDSWFLRIKLPASEVSSNVSPSVRWERRKKPVNSPNPPRAGATQVYHKGRGILFGGVHDIEESEEGIESEFFDQLFAWNIERNRYYPITLRHPRAAAQKQNEGRNSKRERGKADEESLLRNLAALETKEILEVAIEDSDMKQSLQSGNDSQKTVKPLVNAMPHARFNAQLAIQDDILYIFGGTYEYKDCEYTLDEMWAVDLVRLDGMKEIYRKELENWQGINDDESDTETSDDTSDEAEADGEDNERDLLPDLTTDSLKPERLSLAEELGEDESDKSNLAEEDDRPFPRPFESLRDFFTRTSVVWQELVHPHRNEPTRIFSMKEVRKTAFEIAETRWWDCREEVAALEDEQEEAGIGEVVSIADRASVAGNMGRRR